MLSDAFNTHVTRSLSRSYYVEISDWAVTRWQTNRKYLHPAHTHKSVGVNATETINTLINLKFGKRGTKVEVRKAECIKLYLKMNLILKILQIKHSHYKLRYEKVNIKISHMCYLC